MDRVNLVYPVNERNRPIASIDNRFRRRKLNAMRTAICALLISIAFTLSAQPPPPATSVQVPDATTALSIAEPALIKAYGKRQIDYERPLTATLEDGIWSVYGTLCCPNSKGQRTCEVGRCLGGVAELKLRQSDGKVLSISHGK